MSAFAHWLELAGISTVVIGLIKLHLEKTRPPRALWVPFELGRPLGPPSDPEFQREVLLQALTMVSTADKQTLQDFKTEDPRGEADPDWQAPSKPPAEPQSIVEECQSLKANYQQYCVRQSRTSVGVAQVPVAELAELFDAVYEKDEFTAARKDISERLMFRFALDDLKAYYIESALASKYKPCSEQVYSWLWQETLLGRRMRELRQRFIDSDDDKISDIGNKFIVPVRWRD